MKTIYGILPRCADLEDLLGEPDDTALPSN